MKAIRIHSDGSSDVLKYEEVPTPKPKANEVLIQVFATSVNHLEVMITSGKMKDQSPVTFPWIPGYDFAGLIASVGNEVTNFKEGETVYGKCMGDSYAEYMVMDQKQVAQTPCNLTFTESATVPHVGLTAWQALFDHGQLKKGQRVLIHGGAGAVGSFAIQFAKATGATVYATASAEDRRYVESLGTDVFIDYKSDDFTTVAKEMDLVLVLVGGDTQERSYSVLKPGGHLVSTTGPILEDKAREHQVKGISMSVHPEFKELEKITELIEQGKVTCDVAAIYPLKEAATAWETFEHKNPDAPAFSHGKVVITCGEVKNESKIGLSQK